MKKLILFPAALCLLFSLTSCAKTEETSTPLQSASTADAEAPAGSSVSLTSDPETISSSATSTQSELSSLPETPSEPTSLPSINAAELPHKSYALYCADDNRFIFGDNIDVSAAPASLTKLLTASVALRYVKPDEVFTVGTERYLVHSGSSLCLINVGHKLKMCDLIKGLLMASGNDAAYTIAVSTARTVSGDSAMSDTDAVAYFCGLMNDFAKELGMNNSHFATPDGWDDPEQYTTAYDLTLLAKYALSVPEIREIVSTRQIKVVIESGETMTWFNYNKLLYPESEFYCENAIGMKTGTTDNAGYCLIAAFEKDEKTYISVVLGCDEGDDRYRITTELWRNNLE